MVKWDCKGSPARNSYWHLCFSTLSCRHGSRVRSVICWEYEVNNLFWTAKIIMQTCRRSLLDWVGNKMTDEIWCRQLWRWGKTNPVFIYKKIGWLLPSTAKSCGLWQIVPWKLFMLVISMQSKEKQVLATARTERKKGRENWTSSSCHFLCPWFLIPSVLHAVLVFLCQKGVETFLKNFRKGQQGWAKVWNCFCMRNNNRKGAKQKKSQWNSTKRSQHRS